MRLERTSKNIFFASQRYKRDYQAKQIAFKMVHEFMKNYCNVSFVCGYSAIKGTERLYGFQCIRRNREGNITQWFDTFAEIIIAETYSNIFPYVCDISIDISKIKM